MDKDRIIARLRDHEPELRAGVASLSLFGSVARGDDRAASDLDIAVRLTLPFAAGGLAHFSGMHSLKRRLEAIVGCPVDVIAELVRRERLRQNVEQDRAIAF